MKLLITILFFIVGLYANTINFQTFQGDFIQNIKNPSGNIISYKGSLIATDKNYYIWKYTEPFVKEVYILDDSVIINEPELEQTIYTNLSTQLNLQTLLNNAKQESKHSYTTIIEDIKYTLYFKDNILKSIGYVDSVENSVSIVFSNQLINKEIDSKIFLFEQNPDFDIIKQ